MEILDVIRNVLRRKKIVSEIEEDFGGERGKAGGLYSHLIGYVAPAARSLARNDLRASA